MIAQRSNTSSNAGPGGGRPPGMGGGGPMAMMRRGEKPRDFKGTLNKLIQYLGSYKF